MNKLRFDRMIRQAEEGDPEAVAQLKQYIKSHASKANKALKELEQNDMTYFAYKRAMKYLNVDEGVSRFRTVTTGEPIEVLSSRAQEIHTFLSSKTHNVEQNAAAWEKQRKGLMTVIEAGYGRVTTNRMDITRISEALTRAQKTLGNDGLKLTQAEKYNILETLSVAIDTYRENGHELYDADLDLILTRYMTGERIYNNLVAGVIGQERIEQDDNN